MASLFLSPPSVFLGFKKNPTSTTSFSRHTFVQNPKFSLFRSFETNSRKLLKCSASNNNNNNMEEVEEKLKLFSDSFWEFISNPTIERAIKSDQALDELSKVKGMKPNLELLIKGMRFVLAQTKDILVEEKGERERFEDNYEGLTAVDVKKLKSCFGYDTFFATDFRRFKDDWKVIGKLKKPVEEVIPILEKKVSEAVGMDVVLCFIEEEIDEITEQVCIVQSKSKNTFLYEYLKLTTPVGYTAAIVFCIATIGTIALMSGILLKPDATFNDYLGKVVPLVCGFLSILGVSEITTRVTAARYGVKLSPSFLIPSKWTGCFGLMNNYESLLPNNKALFDIPFARTASAYLMSLVLIIAAFVADGSFNGGDNALYVRPEFLDNNPLLSIIPAVIGPYSDELGNVMPYAVEGVGVPVNPLAFAGLLGMVMTSLNLLPFGKLEGGRISQALFGRYVTVALSFSMSVLLCIGGLDGSSLCWTWLLFLLICRSLDELPAKDEITPLGDNRYVLGFVLAIICSLTLFPNSAGTLFSSFRSPPFFQ